MSVHALNRPAARSTEQCPPSRFVSIQTEFTGFSLVTTCWNLLAALLLALLPSAAVSEDTVFLDDDFVFIMKSKHPVAGMEMPSGNLVPSNTSANSAINLGHRNLCSSYTYGPGWKRPMELYLGEGAREFLPIIRLAVKPWNDLVPGLIDLKEDLVTYPYLGRPYIGVDKYKDGVSVIYFPDELDIRGGFVISREVGESDVFIWQDGKVGIGPFSTIMHEIGHAIGLGHISISANVMSYDTVTKKAARILKLFIDLGAFPDYYNKPFAYLDYLVDADPRYQGLGFSIILPGAQDKAMLSCLYHSWEAADAN